MAIRWCGGEDVDFPNGAAVSVDTTVGRFRSAYARCGIYGSSAGATCRSLAFPGGAITSAWLSARLCHFDSSGSATQRLFGFGLSGTVKGLFLGTDSSNTSKLALCKYDGTTTTQLAAESGSTLSSGTLYRLEMQVVDYGTSATVTVYLDGHLLISYIGDVTVAGMSHFDSVYLSRGASLYFVVSEIIVVDEDPRTWPGLATLALNGMGTTDQWTGFYYTINQTTLSDAAPNYTNADDEDQQFNVTNLPAGSVSIKAVKIAARAAKSETSTPTKIALGYNSGGSVAVGSDKTVTTAYTSYEQLNSINPVTTEAWKQSEMNGLQLDVRSKA